MTAITYLPSDGYPTITGATVAYESGQTFDIKAALTAGGGSFSIDDATQAPLAAALDRHPAVKRQGGGSPGTPAATRTIGPVVAPAAPAGGGVLTSAGPGTLPDWTPPSVGSGVVLPTLYDTFVGKTGPPVISDSGHAYVVTGSGFADVTRTGDYLVSTGAAGAYNEFNLGTPPKRLGAGFRFISSGRSTEKSSVGLITWADGNVIPQFSSCHFVIGLTFWSYSVWIKSVETLLRVRYWDVPLSLDKTYIMEVVLDVANGRAYVVEPDGAVHVVSHPLLREGPPNNWACFQNFLYSGTDFNPGFAEIWGDI